MVMKDKKAINAKRKKAAAKKPVVSAVVVNKPAKASGGFDKIYKSPKKTGWQNFVEYLKKRPVFIVLISFLILGAGFAAYNQYQIYQEKQDFKQAEAVLDDLANNIADELGKPIYNSKEKYCSYRSVKLSDTGPPTCIVNVALTYNTSELNEDSIGKISDVMVANNEVIFERGDLISSFAQGDDYNKYSIFDGEFIVKGTQLNCYISASRVILEETNSVMKISCSIKDSSKEHFPVVE
jgi:hypothetical protein